jgi:hypothetical protein
METPAGLSGNALLLWTDTTDKYELETHELLILEDACRERALIERLQGDIDALDDLMTLGSMGQSVINETVKEVRQHRAKYESCIKALKLPSEDAPAGNRSTQARDAAKARWRRPA